MTRVRFSQDAPIYNIKKNMARKIFVDMDGVLADFDKYVVDHLGKRYSPEDGPGGDNEMWAELHKVSHLYFKFEPMSDAYELWDFVTALPYTVEILTAIPRRSSIPDAEQDKRNWIAKHIDLSAVVKIGPYSRDKWKHASSGDILIDDRKDNIEAWIVKGNGLGILHTSANDSILQLKKILGL